MAIRSTSLQVIKGLHAHISDFISLEDITIQVKNIKCGYYPTEYHCGFHMAEGGCFLIATEDMRTFLNDLLQSDKQYSDEQVFAQYTHLLAREIANIVKRQRFNL
jgi:hypothetical protein